MVVAEKARVEANAMGKMLDDCITHQRQSGVFNTPLGGIARMVIAQEEARLARRKKPVRRKRAAKKIGAPEIFRWTRATTSAIFSFDTGQLPFSRRRSCDTG